MTRLQSEACPRLVILDLMMPYVTGMELLIQMRESRPIGPKIAIVVYSADPDPTTRDQAMRLGANGFVEKGRGWHPLRVELEKHLKPA